MWRRLVQGILVLGISISGPAGAEPEPALGAGSLRLAVASSPSDDGVRFEHRASFEVDAVASVVHARHELTVTNQLPDQVSSGYIRSSYVREIGIPVPAGVTGVAATRPDGGRVPVRLEPTEVPVVSFAQVDLMPDLAYRDTQTVVLTYDLPAVAPRSEALFRVNAAFVSFPVFADGDPGLTSIDVRVPAGLEVEVVGDDMEERAEGDVTILHAEPSDPAGFFTSVVARNDDLLLSRPVEMGEHGLVVRAWPDDPAWADFAEAQVRDGVPMLERLIGLPWPATRSIDVLETAAPYLYGYAGWYRPVESVIEVGDELDQQVMLHELSHLWFNSMLIDGRWANEGWANLFAAAAAEALGGSPVEPEPIDPTAPGALPLNAWTTPDLEREVSEEQEAYAYNAAWSVLDQIAAEIGLDAMADVVRATSEMAVAYAGPGLAPLRGTMAWTQLLDLLEDRAGSTLAATLFQQHVLTTDEQELLPARSASRQRYAAQEARGDGWTPPAAVRAALANWRFAQADALMDETDHLLDLRDEIDDTLSGIDAATTGLEATYESSEDLDVVDREARAALEAARALRRGDAAARRSFGPIEVVGLVLTSPDDELDAAVDAFEQGDWSTAGDRSEAAVALADGAARAGVTRLAGAVLLVTVSVALRRWRRRHRVRDEEDEEPACDLADERSPFADPNRSASLRAEELGADSELRGRAR